MPFKTRYGSHYHMTEGCHGATIPCGTEGLTPCSDCCGAGAGTGSGSGTITTGSDIIGVSSMTYDGQEGTLYKLDTLLDPDLRREISSLDGVSTVIVAAEYAPEIRRTGIFVADGYDYAISKANDITEVGIKAMRDSVAAPSVSLSATTDGEIKASEQDGSPASGYESHLGDDWPERRAEKISRAGWAKDICSRTNASMRGDWDVGYASGYVTNGLAYLMDQCDVEPLPKGEDDPYTTRLVDAYIGFGVCPRYEIGGSSADYCVSHALTGISGYKLRLRQTPKADGILKDIRDGIRQYALYPREMGNTYRSAGIPLDRSEFLDAQVSGQAKELDKARSMSSEQRKEEWGEDGRRWASEWLDLTMMPDSDGDPSDFLRRATTERGIEEYFYRSGRGGLRTRLNDLEDRMGEDGYYEFSDEYSEAFKKGADEVLGEFMTQRAISQGKKRRTRYRIDKW